MPEANAPVDAAAARRAAAVATAIAARRAASGTPATASAASAAPAAQVAKPAVETTAQVVTPAPAAPAVETPASEVIVIAEDVERLPAAPAEPSRIEQLSRAPITSQDAALGFLASLSAATAASAADAVDNAMAEADSGGGYSITQPFSILNKQNFQAAKNTPNALLPFMPQGAIPYIGIPCGYRVAATSWNGASADKKPPFYRFTLPNPRVTPSLAPLYQALIKAAGNVQYHSYPQEYLTNPEYGRLTIEFQLLLWNPLVDFLVISAAGFKSTVLSKDAMSKDMARDSFLKNPLAFSIDTEVVNRAKIADGAKNKTWTDYFIKAEMVSPVSNPAVADCLTEWKTMLATDAVRVANVVQAFNAATDTGTSGLPLELVERRLAAFGALPTVRSTPTSKY